MVTGETLYALHDDRMRGPWQPPKPKQSEQPSTIWTIAGVLVVLLIFGFAINPINWMVSLAVFAGVFAVAFPIWISYLRGEIH